MIDYVPIQHEQREIPTDDSSLCTLIVEWISGHKQNVVAWASVPTAWAHWGDLQKYIFVWEIHMRV